MGFVKDGTVYLNLAELNPETPIHEFGHVWTKVLEQANPNIHKEAIEIAKRSPGFKQLKQSNEYGHLTDDQIADEVLADAIGKAGKKLYEAEQNQQQSTNNQQPKTQLEKIATNIWKWITTKLKKQDQFFKDKTPNQVAGMTLEEIANAGATELLSGNNLEHTENIKKVGSTQFSLLNNSDFYKEGNIKPQVLKEIRKEKEQIIKQAKANGTYLKAPNGKDSNLNEEQWVNVRTKRFKDWFGDWEAANKLNLIDKLKSIEIEENNLSGIEIKDAYRAIKESKNNLDNKKVRFVNETLGKITRHKGFDTKQIIPKLNNIFENAVPLGFKKEEQKEGHKPHTNFIGYHDYLGKINFNGNEYYVRFTVQEKKAKAQTINKGFIPNELHSTFVTDIKIYNANPTVHTKNNSATNVDESVIDTKLQNFFQTTRKEQENTSKVIDENGEPLVVYHGSNELFYEFNTDGINQLAFFTDNLKVAKDYGNTITEAFLNIPDLETEDFYNGWWKDQYGKAERLVGRLDRKLIDGFLFKNAKDPKIADNISSFPVSNIYAVKENNRIKSATDNVGTYSESEDIRFQIQSSSNQNQTQLDVEGQNEVPNLISQINRLKTRAAKHTILRKEFVAAVKQLIDSKQVSELQKRELNKILTRAKDIRTAKKLNQSIEDVKEILLGVDTRIFQRQFTNLLKRKYKTTQGGRSKAGILRSLK